MGCPDSGAYICKGFGYTFFEMPEAMAVRTKEDALGDFCEDTDARPPVHGGDVTVFGATNVVIVHDLGRPE